MYRHGGPPPARVSGVRGHLRAYLRRGIYVGLVRKQKKRSRRVLFLPPFLPPQGFAHSRHSSFLSYRTFVVTTRLQRWRPGGQRGALSGLVRKHGVLSPSCRRSVPSGSLPACARRSRESKPGKQAFSDSDVRPPTGSWAKRGRRVKCGSASVCTRFPLALLQTERTRSKK